jgi:3'-5' exoribonuclease
MINLNLDNYPNHIWIKDIKEDDQVNGSYLVKVKRVGNTKKGDPFISITLSDRTGDMEARVWENASELSPLFNEGDVVEVAGYASSYRAQVQLTLSQLKISGEKDPALFLETTQRDIKEMVETLRGIVKNTGDHHLKVLSERFLSDSDFMEHFKKAPAAKNFHHNYIGGLLEHTLSVCEMSLLAADHYKALDRDMLVIGAFLHDIGKIKEFKYGTRIDYSDEGRLLGHLVLGVGMLEERLAKIKNFPRETALRLKHLMLSHHGQYEFGSPKRPKFLEAFALHQIDDLDAKMNGLGRFMEKDMNKGVWTDYNKMFERYFLKDSLPPDVEKRPEPEDNDRQKALFA